MNCGKVCTLYSVDLQLGGRTVFFPSCLHLRFLMEIIPMMLDIMHIMCQIGESTELLFSFKFNIWVSYSIIFIFFSSSPWRVLCRYDREEHSTMFNDSSSLFHGDETSYQKKEAELAKKLVHTVIKFFWLLKL